jgi:hypothetical protein
MSADEKEKTETPEPSDEGKEKDEKETPELSDEGKKEVEQMQQAYEDDRQTAVLPGTDGTITGVAINEWLDDDGNPKFGKDEQQEDGDKPNEQQEDSDKQKEDAS